MTVKKINLLKVFTLGLSAVIGCILIYGLSGIFKKAPEKVAVAIVVPDSSAIFVSSISENNRIVPLRDSIVNFGMTLLGTPYADGACSKDGFDCSGLVYYIFQHFAIQVPRSSSQFKDFGMEVPIDNVKKGDILVFLSPTRNAIGHVGIVTNPKGMASEFIHSSSGSEMKVIISGLTQEGYKKRFVKAVDVLGDSR